MSIQLTNDLGSQGAGPFKATVTVTSGTSQAVVTISFIPGQNVSSNTPVTPTTLTVGVASGGTATNLLTLTNNTGTQITLSVSTSENDTNSWLSVGTPNPNPVGAGGVSQISVTTTAGVLPNATYNGTVTINVSPGTPVTVPVVFTIGATGLTLSTNNLGLVYASGASQSQTVAVGGVAQYNATATTSSGGNWLQLSAGALTGVSVTNIPASTQLTVFVGQAAAVLGSGAYQGTIQVTDSSNSGNTAQIAVTLTVTAGTTSITVTPTSLGFSYQTGGSLVVPYETLILSTPAGFYTTSVDVPWLYVTPTQGVIPSDNPQVHVSNLGSMTAGAYTGRVTISAQGLTLSVQVQLVITDGPVAYASYPTSTGNNGTVVFTSQGAVASPASQTVSVYSSDGSPLALSLVSFPNWATATFNGNQLTITPMVSGIGAALLSGAVVVTASNSSISSNNTITNSPISIPVVLVANGGGAGALVFTPTNLPFQSTSAGVSPSSAALAVTAGTATAFTISSTSWINVSYSGSLITPQALTVTVSPGTLPVGNYTGEIDFNANGVIQRVPVSLQVLSGGGGSTGQIAADKQAIALTAQAGGQAVTSAINVTSSGAPVTYTVSVSSQGNWLKSDTTTKATPSTVTITADPTSLGPGFYQGTVTINSQNTIVIPVTFTVNPQPMISVGTTALSFTYRVGGDVPPAQAVLVSGGGGFTAVAASDTGNWLAVAPTSGATGTSISVSVNPAGLNAGLHTGTVTVNGTNGLTGQAVISVTLTVTAPLPTIATAGNAASYIQGPVSPGEMLTLTGTSLGAPGLTFSAQLDSTGKVSTSLGGVQVLINGFASPMIYVSATQVSAVVPYEVERFTTANVVVKYQNQTSNAFTFAVVPTAPGIFTQNQAGSGAAGYNPDTTVNGPNNPAPKLGYVALFLTGEGQLNPPGVTGQVNPTTGGLPAPAAAITVSVDGQPTTYNYAGGVPGAIQGVMQLNVQIPASARSGTVPVLVTIGGNNTQNGVTVSVQ
jgi:uncharacterized protein (TIGR03437 family)